MNNNVWLRIPRHFSFIFSRFSIIKQQSRLHNYRLIVQFIYSSFFIIYKTKLFSWPGSLGILHGIPFFREKRRNIVYHRFSECLYFCRWLVLLTCCLTLFSAALCDSSSFVLHVRQTSDFFLDTNCRAGDLLINFPLEGLDR